MLKQKLSVNVVKKNAGLLLKLLQDVLVNEEFLPTTRLQVTEVRAVARSEVSAQVLVAVALADLAQVLVADLGSKST